MSSFYTHILIAKKAQKLLPKEAQEIINKYNQYYLLGSIGPDMPYFESIISMIYTTLTDRPYKPKGMEPYSYQLHSKSPNIMPLKMLEITWKESDLNKYNWDEIDKQRFAFTCGYLAHMATDHIIHPIVQKIAGPYYKRKSKRLKGSREIHAECETVQDLFLLSKEHNAIFYAITFTGLTAIANYIPKKCPNGHMIKTEGDFCPECGAKIETQNKYKEN